MMKRHAREYSGDVRPTKGENARGAANENAGRSRSGPERESAADADARLYGVGPVLEALRAARRAIEHITIAEGAHDHRLSELIRLARAADIPLRRTPRNDLARLVGADARHQGVVAKIAAAHYTGADELLSELQSRIGSPDPPLAVVLDGVEDPRNLGAIVRTVECAGAHGIFIPERRSVGLTDTVAKTAAGALEHTHVARVPNLVRLIDDLKERNIWTVGTSADAGTEYTAWDWTQASVIVLGSEGAGLHRLVREHCDTLVRIPTRGAIRSLNVSVAAGIVLYEALRQRGARTKIASANRERAGAADS